MNIHSQSAKYWLIQGQVQGVGFRPYIYRLAKQHNLIGWVRNAAGQVEIWAQGSVPALQAFADALVQQAPPLAQPHIVNETYVPLDQNLTTFNILESITHSHTDIHVPPDYFTCQDCLEELHNPQDRRYHYPFINCTQCGPRYTLIQQLPYDRPHTSMATFPLCPACAQEYHDPGNRRFHAQPIACPDCGPQLYFQDKIQKVIEPQAALTASLKALSEGKIVAIKGIGGYHLYCLANHDQAILTLRQRKKRPFKPFAILCQLEHLSAQLSTTEKALLLDPKRPIVLLKSQILTVPISSQVAPHLDEIGILLPYSPLHHLLLMGIQQPLVATSANISGEPVLTDNLEVEQRLSTVADAFLHHNRPIVRPADDSVYKIIADQPTPLRLGRGTAPLEFSLPRPLSCPTLAVGGHLKNTLTLAWEQHAVISPHIGDLDSPRSLHIFTQLIDDLQKLYALKIQRIVCDSHPNYASTRWAQQQNLPVDTIFHHHAHASALVGECYQTQHSVHISTLAGKFHQTHPWLILTWDGLGLGPNQQLWGGETLYGHPGHWQRIGHLRPFSLLGGERAAKEPWRCAAALCWEIGESYPSENKDISLLFQAWQHGFNCPFTTSIGRLFDGAAALMNLLQTSSFEGQAPLWLETLYDPNCHSSVPLPVAKNAQGLWEIDWQPLIPLLIDSNRTLEERSTLFHNSLAEAICLQIQYISQEFPITQVGLCGGVFQNRHLTEYVQQKLIANSIPVFLQRLLPSNDASLSFGQIIEILFR